MTHKWVVFLGMFVLNVFAAPVSSVVKIDMKIRLNGATTHPTVLASYGERGTVTQRDQKGNGIEVSVLPTRMKNDRAGLGRAVLLNFEVAEFKNGERLVVSASKVAVRLGHAAQITQATDRAKFLALDLVPSEIVD